MKATAIILAAGSGTRMAADVNKVLMKLEDQSAVIRCLRTFAETGIYDSFIVVCRPEDRMTIERKVADHLPDLPCRFCVGGSERQYSVRNALSILPEDTEIVSVHDAARCFVTPEIIERSVASAAQYGSGVAAVDMTDTVKRVVDGVVEQTLDRNELVSVQTPQSFSKKLLISAHQQAEQEGRLATDDAALVEFLGVPVHISTGSSDNIKLTYRQDVERGKRILRRRSPGSMRVGTGFDVHVFTPERSLVLGGVRIPDSPGLSGHSDADVLVHAAMDALLGAAGLPDIGVYFPPSDERYRGASSIDLLREVGSRLRLDGYELVNLDCTLLLERPKVQQYTSGMRLNLARALEASPDQINVKATTLEQLGPLGRGEGAAASAVCLLGRNSHA